MNSPVRVVYRAILQLHPPSFRNRFGEEMLWIFDEQTREGRAFQLLFDVCVHFSFNISTLNTLREMNAFIATLPGN